MVTVVPSIWSDSVKRLLMPSVFAMLAGTLGLSSANGGTLSACGWRGTTDLRCYEETNGCFNYQHETTGTCHKERYWSGGVNEARPWCHKNGGVWLSEDDSRQLSERCSLP